MSDVTYDYYYNTAWQVVEVHEDGDSTFPLEEYFWHAYYVDAPAVRFYDATTNGSIVLQFYCHDANFNVTAITDSTAAVLERYDYRPYGEVVIMDENFTEIPSTAIDNRYMFTGREYDAETGLYHFRHRYYHALLGRLWGGIRLGTRTG